MKIPVRMILLMAATIAFIFVTTAATYTGNYKDDNDKDGLCNREEEIHGTDPNNRDSDGVPDGSELEQGTNPLDIDTNNDGVHDGREDHDVNGIPDGEEKDDNGKEHPYNPPTNIPEFPTVALPIVTVIGLALLFQHKKN